MSGAFEGVYLDQIAEAVRAVIGPIELTDKAMMEVIGGLMSYAAYLGVHTGADPTGMRRMFSLILTETEVKHRDCERFVVADSEEEDEDLALAALGAVAGKRGPH